MACVWRSVTLSPSSAARRFCLVFQRRYRYKKKWAVNLPSKTPSELALEHFDAFYKPQFGNQWPSIRVALLSLPKYAAIINHASEAESSVQHLRELGAIDLIQEAVNIVHNTKLHQDRDSDTVSVSSNMLADDRNNITGQSSIDTANISQGEERSRDSGIHSSENVSTLEGSLSSVSSFPAQQSETAEQSDGNRNNLHVDDMKNLLAPDAMKSSSDLEYFMPTEKVFSEKEELALQEYTQNAFQERAVSVPVVPGQFPVLPKSLTVMAFPPADVSDFPRPHADASRLLSYYLLDAASLLPVLALDVQPEEKVLDLCAAPGGKTLALLQVMLTAGGHLDSNDVSRSRMKRLKTVLRSYLPEHLQEDMVTVTQHNGLGFREPVYNKVLVDVPCNSDRHVLVEDDNNLFKPGRIKERLNMTTQQKDLLLAGIKSCKPGGSVVYSTCTLAAAQNDGVVQAAVEELWETSDIDVVVEDLTPIRTMFAPFFSFHSRTRLGLQVVPSLINNYGPAYCCKLRRLC